MDDDDRIALEQEIADLRFALRQATDRASLAEVKCSQLLESGRLTAAEREAVAQAATVADAACEEAKRWVGLPRWANGGVDDSSWQHVADSNAARAATLRGLLERLG